MKVVFCIPTVDRPFQPCLDAMEASVPVLDDAGIEHQLVFERGNAYISAARSQMLRKAMDAKPDAVIFIDHDLSWRPRDLLKLIQADADVVGGTYRFKKDEVEYMGTLLTDEAGRPKVHNGLICADRLPAGFLKVTARAVDWFMRKYPELVYGPAWNPSVDLFNHGAHKGLWWGEDYAFCRRWTETGEPLYLLPDVELTHHTSEKAYPGNYHEYLLRQPGGSKEGH
jgi:glycosyltransferase involved in cell wall biosynthesis